jgi:hypothetical protein
VSVIILFTWLNFESHPADLATSNHTRQVPYAAIGKDIQAFISPEYLPDDTTIQDP